MGLAKIVKTAVGLQNELTVNLDVEDGLTNGATCTTKKVTPGIIWVEFDDNTIGRSRRTERKHLSKNSLKNETIDQQWTPLQPITREFPIGKYKNVKLSRMQYPLRLACAKTIHRSQGSTMNTAVVQLPHKKNAHLHYVALSRVTSLKNLTITGAIDPSLIIVDDDVKKEMQRLRSTSKLQISKSQMCLYNLPSNVLKIYTSTIASPFIFITVTLSMTLTLKLLTSACLWRQTLCS